MRPFLFGFSVFLPTMQPAEVCCGTPLVLGHTCVDGLGHVNALVGLRHELTCVKVTDAAGAVLPVW